MFNIDNKQGVFNLTSSKVPWYFKNLNAQQLNAVTSDPRKPLLVSAGPGSGKTTVLVSRIIYLINHGVLPEKILAITFTRKAADEMSTRIKEIVKGKSTKLTVCNFHQFCFRILRTNSAQIGIKGSLTVCDNSEQFTIIKELYQEWKERNEYKLQKNKYDQMKSSQNNSNFTNHRFFVDQQKQQRQTENKKKVNERKVIGEMVNFIKWAKVHGHQPNEFFDEYKEIYAKYQEKIHTLGKIDFADFLIKTVNLLRIEKGILRKYQKQYRVILVDEFQDTNQIQFELLRLLTQNSQSITVVGDIDQSIYNFRGAKPQNFLEFSKYFPNVVSINLEQNYRSTQTILKAASSMIAYNPNRFQKRLWTNKSIGSKIKCIYANTPLHESVLVTNEIKRMMKNDRSLKFSSFAVLFRVRYVSIDFELEFSRQNIPHGWKSGNGFYRRPEITDIISYLNVIAGNHINIQVMRILNIPNRNLGKKTINCIKSISENKKISFFKALKIASQYYKQKYNKKAKSNRNNNQNQRKGKGIGTNTNTGTGTSTSTNTATCQNQIQKNPNIKKIQIKKNDAIIKFIEEIKQRQLAGISKFIDLISKLILFSKKMKYPTEIIQKILEETRYFENKSDKQNNNKNKSMNNLNYLNNQLKVATPDENDENSDINYSRKKSLLALLKEAHLYEEKYKNEEKLKNQPLYLLKGFVYVLKKRIFLSITPKNDNQKSQPNRILLTTIHQAKGLEFPIVFVVRFNNGIIPLPQSSKKNQNNNNQNHNNQNNTKGYGVINLEEERRIAMVAFTRAKETLVLSCSKQDNHGNMIEPSQFFNEIPKDCLEFFQINQEPNQNQNNNITKNTTFTTTTTTTTSSSSFLLNNNNANLLKKNNENILTNKLLSEKNNYSELNYLKDNIFSIKSQNQIQNNNLNTNNNNTQQYPQPKSPNFQNNQQNKYIQQQSINKHINNNQQPTQIHQIPNFKQQQQQQQQQPQQQMIQNKNINQQIQRVDQQNIQIQYPQQQQPQNLIQTPSQSKNINQQIQRVDQQNIQISNFTQQPQNLIHTQSQSKNLNQQNQLQQQQSTQMHQIPNFKQQKQQQQRQQKQNPIQSQNLNLNTHQNNVERSPFFKKQKLDNPIFPNKKHTSIDKPIPVSRQISNKLNDYHSFNKETSLSALVNNISNKKKNRNIFSNTMNYNSSIDNTQMRTNIFNKNQNTNPLNRNINSQNSPLNHPQNRIFMGITQRNAFQNQNFNQYDQRLKKLRSNSNLTFQNHQQPQQQQQQPNIRQTKHINQQFTYNPNTFTSPFSKN
ncbi:DNA helicase ii [Anaeramoeba flamelloides]|uniref:DNA 3'-5' helicase n=1 Tax=Anaeramoeba flamelloides TaxID=1746091 RepID=A0ABQ8X3S0_9EUKA|nr:DNA helicase ii [Anaeramoeba flamelloides]